MISRKIETPLREALADTPVVLLQGARQTGKTTLIREGFIARHDRLYLSLDDLTVLSIAREDPQGFIAGLQGDVALDEVQRVPQLALAIKRQVDRDRRPGRFLLTGSARVLSLQPFPDALVGRMQALTLWPLTQGEIHDSRDGFIDRLFAAEPLTPGAGIFNREEYVSRAMTGGFPEAVGRTSDRRRSAWFEAYLSTLVQRDVTDLARLEHLATMPGLLRVLASRSAGMLNTSALSREVGIPNATLVRYLALLEALFCIVRIPAWSVNLGKRAVKSPKVLFADSGLLAFLLGLEAGRLDSYPIESGRLLETFVGGELIRQLTWSETRGTLYHFRTHAGREVDFVIEDARGRLVGVEVKASASVGAGDFVGLKALREACPKRFLRGVIMYSGSEVINLGDQLQAVPLAEIWM